MYKRQQWTRAKGFDTFGSFGPGIVSGIDDPDKLVIKTILNDQERQNYPVADMIFRPFKLVSMISHDTVSYTHLDVYKRQHRI